MRPGAGRQPYRLEQRVRGAWRPVGGTLATGALGFLRRTVTARPGTVFRIRALASNEAGYGVAVP